MNIIKQKRQQEGFWDRFTMGIVSIQLFCIIPLVFLPRVIFPSLFNYAPFWKELTFALCVALLAIGNPELLRKGRYTAPFLFGCALIAAAMVITFGLGKIPLVVVLLGSVPYVTFAFALYIALQIERRKLILLVPGVVALGVVGGIGIFLDMKFTLFRFLTLEGIEVERSNIYMYGGVIRSGFLFTGATYASALMALNVILSFLLMLYGQRQSTLYWLYISAVCGVIGVISTLARVGYAAIAFSTPAIALILLQVSKRFSVKAIVFIIMAGVVGGAIYGAVDPEIRSTIVERSETIFSSQKRAGDIANRQRIAAWKEGLEALNENIVLGSGIGWHQPRSKSKLASYGWHFESGALIVLNEAGFLGIIMVTLVFWIFMRSLIKTMGNNFPAAIVQSSVGFAILFIWWINPIWSDVGFSIYSGIILGILVRLGSRESFNEFRIGRHLARSSSMSMVGGAFRASIGGMK